MDIILMEIANEGNLGAISRCMANFGFRNLVLVDPQCDEGSIETIKRAKHSKDILNNLKVTDKNILEEYDYLIGTTAKTGSDYNIPRVPVRPEEMKDKDYGDTRVGLLIGREGDGLSNEELKRCDLTITIPTSKEYPTLNISHAVAILLYEMSKAEENITSHIKTATKREKDILLEELEKAIQRMSFTTEEKRETQRKVWRRMIGKAGLTKREAYAIIGFLKKSTSEGKQKNR
ncbi:MAG: RNA methyltransferase [Nanobdellota archaeon]